jgi:O-antigen ligase
LNYSVQLNKTLLRLFLIITGLFPILPFKIKGVVALFFVLIVLFSIKKRKLEINYLFLLNTSLFVFYLISLTYSANVKGGISKLETTLSLFIFPMGFLFLSANKKAINNIVEYGNIFKYTFIASSFLLSILLFILSFNYGDYITQKVNINRFVYDLSEGFLWMRDHPIYLSIYLSISLFLIAEIFNQSKRKHQIILLLVGIFEVIVVSILSRKGVIISLLLSFLIFSLMKIKNKKKVLFSFFIFVTAIIFLGQNYFPDTAKRFREVFDTKSYDEVVSYSSTSIRYGIYKCSFEKIKESWLFGYGIGDVGEELRKCYKDKSEVLYIGNFNSHNQYLGIILRVGVFGLLLFVISIILNLIFLYNRKDYSAFSIILMLVLVMLTENIMERQNGVILFSLLINYFVFRNLIIKN